MPNNDPTIYSLGKDRLRPTELGRPSHQGKIGNTIVVTDGEDTYTIDLFEDREITSSREFSVAQVRMVGPDIGRPQHYEAETWQGALRTGLQHVSQSLLVGIHDRERQRKERR